MRAKLYLIPELVTLALVASACKSPSSDSSAIDAGAAPITSTSASSPIAVAPFAPLAGDPARAAIEAKVLLADKLRQGLVRPDDPDYLRFRRALAAGAPLWRRREMLAGEVIFGPSSAIDESGGALARLDLALVQAKSQSAADELETIAAPVRLFVETSKRVAFSKTILAQVLSATAYELGAIAMESTVGIPDGLAAVIADCQGTLDFIERAAAYFNDPLNASISAAHGNVVAAIAPLRTRLDAAAAANQFDNRASFVVLTGDLGSALRKLAAATSIETKLPYRPRHSRSSNPLDESISALTVPALRTALRDETTRQAYVHLGRALFFDKRLSRGNVRSCASCHVPDKALADARPRPSSLDPAVTLRHTPSLLYGSLNAAYLWDGRVLTAERQALGVIHARAEMGLSDADMVDVLRRADDLRPLFAALSTSASVTADDVGLALAAFQAQAFVPADAPIDRFARGEQDALSDSARAGFDVFVGPGRCARCHVPPFFGGSRPRDFATPIFAVLGVPVAKGSTTIDPDRGRGAITNRPADEHAFKTPTVRNIVRTAPYFHHGAFSTLDDVIDFYDQGGGSGQGLSVPNQDPDVRKLGLSSPAKRSLLEFLRTALLDATSPHESAGARSSTH